MKLVKAVIRTPVGADGHIAWERVPVGATVFVTVSDPESPLRGRHVPLTKRPDGQMATDFAGARASGYKYGKWTQKIGKRSPLAYAHRAIDVGATRESKADVEKRKARREAQAANAPVEAELRKRRAEARKSEEKARESFMAAVGIDKVKLSNDELEQVKITAKEYATNAGMNEASSQAYAAAVARAAQRKAQQQADLEAKKRLDAIRNNKARQGWGKPAADKIDLTDEKVTPPVETPRLQISMPEAPVGAQTPEEIEHAVNQHFVRSEPAATTGNVEDVVTVPEPPKPTITEDDAFRRLTGGMPSPAEGETPGTPTGTDQAPPPAPPPEAFQPPTINLPEARPLDMTDEKKAEAALDAYQDFLSARHAERQLHSQLHEVPPLEIASSAGVRELRMKTVPLTAEELKKLDEEYDASLATPGEETFYEAISEHWNDDVGYTYGSYIADGAASALTGLAGKYVERRFDVGRLTANLSPEAAALVIAGVLRQRMGAESYDRLVEKVADDNAANLLDQEKRAMGRHRELKRQGEEIARQKGDGSLQSESTIALLEADNLMQQRDNLGTALGSLSASSAFLAALEHFQKSDDANVTINVGSDHDAAVERMDALHLRGDKAKLMPDSKTGAWRIHTTVGALQRFVKQAEAQEKLRADLEKIKTDTSDTAGYLPDGFKETFVSPDGQKLPVQLRTNQRNDIEWLKKLGGGLITRVTGAGKTLTMLGYQGDLLKARPDSRHINIVPPGQVKQWVAEARNFTDLPVVEIPEGSDKKTRQSIYEGNAGRGAIFVTSHRDASFDVESLEKLRLGSICIDEPQNLKSRTSSNQSAAAKRIMKIDVPHRVALTATPARESIVEAFDTVTWATKQPMRDDGGNIIRDRSGHVRYTKPLGSRVGFQRAFSGFGGGTNAQDAAVQRLAARELAPYVSGDLEKKRNYEVNYKPETVKRTGAQIARQKAIEADADRVVAEEIAAVKPEDRTGPWKKRAQQRALNKIYQMHRDNLHGGGQNAKVNSLLSNVADDVAAGKQKHVIFVDSDAQRKAVYHGLLEAGYKQNQIANITRSATKAQVEKRKEGWKKDEGDSFIIIDQSSQAGHNLNEGHVYHLMGNPDDAAGMMQGIGRLDRAPRTGDVDVRTYRHEDSPFEDHRWNKIDAEMKILRATAPGLVKAMVRFVVRLVKSAGKQLSLLPGMVLAPSKKNPGKRRWQQIQQKVVRPPGKMNWHDDRVLRTIGDGLLHDVPVKRPAKGRPKPVKQPSVMDSESIESELDRLKETANNRHSINAGTQLFGTPDKWLTPDETKRVKALQAELDRREKEHGTPEERRAVKRELSKRGISFDQDAKLADLKSLLSKKQRAVAAARVNKYLHRPEPTAHVGEDESAYVPVHIVSVEEEDGKKHRQYMSGDGKPITDKAMVERLNKLAIPPAWTDVKVAADPDAELQATGYDKDKRKQYRYSAAHVDRKSREKFKRLKRFRDDIPKIDKAIDDALGSDVGDLLDLIRETAIRIGSDRKTGAEEKAYGASTLLGKHVKIDDQGKVTLDFIGKKAVHIVKPIVNDNLKKMLLKRKKVAGDNGKLFNGVTGSQANAFLKQVGAYSVKDFRTYHGTRIARAYLKAKLEKIDVSALEKRQVQKVIRETCEAAAAFLGNTPAVCKSSYINPIVWQEAGIDVQ